MRNRWYQHRHELKKRIHHNIYLQRSWDRHGSAAFEFRVLLICDPKRCVEMEQMLIDEFRSAERGFGFNLRKNAENNLGLKHTEATRHRLREARRRRVISPETRRKISEFRKSRPKEELARFSKSFLGKHHTPEVRAKISAARKQAEAIKKSAL